MSIDQDSSCDRAKLDLEALEAYFEPRSLGTVTGSVQDTLWTLQAKGDVLWAIELAPDILKVYGLDFCSAEVKIPWSNLLLHG